MNEYEYGPALAGVVNTMPVAVYPLVAAVELYRVYDVDPATVAVIVLDVIFVIVAAAICILHIHF